MSQQTETNPTGTRSYPKSYGSLFALGAILVVLAAAAVTYDNAFATDEAQNRYGSDTVTYATA